MPSDSIRCEEALDAEAAHVIDVGRVCPQRRATLSRALDALVCMCDVHTKSSVSCTIIEEAHALKWDASLLLKSMEAVA